jgi:CspA family cold shock protein
MARGVIREWRHDDGWGVIDSDETPGGCWVHFTHLRMAGWRAAEPGQGVTFTFEPGPQDGFDYRAVDVTIDGVPRVEPEPPQPASPAYQSRLTIDWHEPR